jgi:hypothetical protein
MTPADPQAARELAQRITNPQDWYRVTASGKLIYDCSPAAAAALLNRLADELEALRKDAERYRWLRTNHPIHDNSPFICRNFGASFSQWTGEDADTVIDAAMKEQSNG